MATETTTTKPKTKKSTKKNDPKSIITPRMQKEMDERKAKQSAESLTMSPEVEAFVNGANTVVIDTEKTKQKPETVAPVKSEEKTTETKPKGKVGRPALGIEKKKVTFDMPTRLIEEIDQCAFYYGITRAAYVARAVMKQVREDQKTENLDLYK